MNRPDLVSLNRRKVVNFTGACNEALFIRRFKLNNDYSDFYEVRQSFTDSSYLNRYGKYVREKGVPDYGIILRQLVNEGYANGMNQIELVYKKDAITINGLRLSLVVEGKYRDLIEAHGGAIGDGQLAIRTVKPIITSR